MDPSALPRYDRTRSYEWNYAHAPEPVDVAVPGVGGAWNYCGLPCASPLGIAAGPLLNGRWILYYASLGFDILTYKTVRTRARPCYSMPNLQPVAATEIRGDGVPLPAQAEMDGGWAVSTFLPWKREDGKEQDLETSDGYGTGYVLHLARLGGVPSSDERIARGIRWLKTHQRESGRWFTRSLNRDGRSFLSHAGTAFALAALHAAGEGR